MQQRALQLASVAAMLYDAGGASIRLPLHASNPLVCAMRKALDRELKLGGSGVGKGATGSQLAEALLEGMLQAQDEDGSDSSFPFLIVGGAGSHPCYCIFSHRENCLMQWAVSLSESRSAVLILTESAQLALCH